MIALTYPYYPSSTPYEVRNKSRLWYPDTPWSDKCIPIRIPEYTMKEKQIPIAILRHSVKWKMNSDFDSHTPHEGKNESRFWSTSTLWSQKWISILIHEYPMKSKMNSDFHLQVLSEAKNEFRFRLPTLYEAQNEFQFRLPTPYEAKNEFRFRLLCMSDGQNESRFRLSTPYEAKNELRFCFIHTLKGQNESRFCFIRTSGSLFEISITLPKHSQKADQKPFLAASTSDDIWQELLYLFAEMRWFTEVGTGSLQRHSAKLHRSF